VSRALFLCLVTAAVLPGQAPVSGPVLGIVFDQSRGLRPVLGIPGAATLGDPFDPGFPVRAAVVSPSQDAALVLPHPPPEGTEAPRELQWVRFDGSSVTAAPIEGAFAAPDRMVFSPSGNAAALYSADLKQVQILHGLPNHPLVAHSIELFTIKIGNGSELEALAVNDAGDSILAAFPESVWLWKQGASPQLLGVPGRISALAFRAGSSADALMASAESQQVWLLSAASGQAEVRLLADTAQEINIPTKIVFDESSVLVASSGSSEIVRLDLTGGVISRTACPCNVTTLANLVKNTFRLNEPSDGPLWIYDSSPNGFETTSSAYTAMEGGSPAGSPRVLFIPPDPPQDSLTPPPVEEAAAAGPLE
jgi:hypothetical protein